MKYKKEFDQMLEQWGEKSQINMCIEEMSELTKELCKYFRYNENEGYSEEQKRKNLENIKEEIADVLNTVEQMAYIFGEEEINKIRGEKVERTMKKLNK